MTTRRKATFLFMILGWLFLLGGTVWNLVQVANDKEITVDRTLFTPGPAALIVTGVLCLIVAIILGWSHQGNYKSEMRETNEPKSTILKLTQTEKGTPLALIRFRNGDKHPLHMDEELAQTLVIGTTGIAKIRGYELLEFTPDPESPTNKAKKTIKQP